MTHVVGKPWYREPWPWLLMLGPFVVIVAGVITTWLAIVTNDGLVSEDYYKQGLQVGKTLARSERAGSLGLEARIAVTAEALTVRLGAAAPGFVPPPRLTVTVSHPTRAGLDQTRVLERSGDKYAASFRLPASGHWLVAIEDGVDGASSWRLLGNVVLPAAGEVVIGGAEAAIK